MSGDYLRGVDSDQPRMKNLMRLNLLDRSSVFLDQPNLAEFRDPIQDGSSAYAANRGNRLMADRNMAGTV